MKKLTFILLLISFNANSIDLILGGVSKHFSKTRYRTRTRNIRYNNNHKIVGIGEDYNNFYFSISSFENSYYKDSVAISATYKVGPVYIGAIAANNYETNSNSFSNGIILAPSIRYSFKNITVFSMYTAVIAAFSIEL